MDNRIKLQKLFKSLIGNDNVYYQTPTLMKYPCIKYERSNFDTDYADNKKYKQYAHYTVIYITSNPDDPNIAKIEDLNYCQFNRQYVSDNLYHCVFDFYY